MMSMAFAWNNRMEDNHSEKRTAASNSENPDKSIKFDIEYLRGAARQREIRSLKERSYDLMQITSGAQVIDIGCGPGVDTVELASRVGPTGRVTGIDIDPDMVAAANKAAIDAGVDKWTQHLLAGSVATLFENGSFDACRCERVLQHLSSEDVTRTILEAKRVLRRDGIMVFIDSDWATFSVHSRDVCLERRLAELRVESLQNPFVARSMADIFVSNDLELLQTEITPVRLTFERIDLLLAPVVERAILGSTISLLQWEAWKAELMQAEKRGTLVASLCMITCCGKVK